MSTRAVFFDWYNTLARYDPPAESVQVAACESYGITVDPQMVRAGIAEADCYFYQENALSRVDKRPANEQVELYTRYEDIILKKAGANVPQGMALPVWMKVRDMARGSRFVLFDDVLPALSELRSRSIITGLISNLQQDMAPLLTEAGLITMLDYIVGPKEAGVEKPDPRIFQYALSQARVDPVEALHVGDQCDIDIAGARAAGLTPVLLDRYGIHPNPDSLCISSLTQVMSLL